MQVVAHLDVFLVFVGGLVNLVVAFGFKKEMPHLTGRHRNQPSHKRGDNRVNEKKNISHQKRNSADEVKGLVHVAVVVIAMVIPALGLKGLLPLAHKDSW